MGSDAPKTEGELGEGPPRRRTASRESQAAVARRWLTGQKRPRPHQGDTGGESGCGGFRATARRPWVEGGRTQEMGAAALQASRDQGGCSVRDRGGDATLEVMAQGELSRRRASASVSWKAERPEKMGP